MKSIEEMLPLYCCGMLSEEENGSVRKWAEEEPGHMKILQDMLDVCMDMDALEMMASVDTEKALRRVKGRIGKNRMETYMKWMRNAAAVMFIPLLGAVTYIALNGNDGAEACVEVCNLEFRTNPGMTGKVLLPDGSAVIMNSGSVLRYPSVFVSGENRVVEFEGEAYFDIARDEERTFVVKTSPSERIEVHGTEFNLDAYPGRNSIATLVKGSISFCYIDKNGKNENILMTPNHRLEYNHGNGIISMKETSCKAETAWKDNKILLEKTPMTEILEILSKRYDVDFVVKDASIRNMTFSGGTITMTRLEYLLESLSISSSIKWRHLPSDDAGSRPKIELY